MTIQQSLITAKEELKSVTENPKLEAEALLAHVLSVSREYLYTWPDQMLSAEMTERFKQHLARRLSREPLFYITGQREFWSLPLRVTKDTLIPRPETELLVEEVLKRLSNNTHAIVADLGTGSGAIAIALAYERPDFQLIATDISEEALKVAKQNAKDLSLANLHFYHGHFCSALPEIRFDAIVSNPPYIGTSEWEHLEPELSFEPRLALVSGEDGLTAIREIARNAKSYLREGGHLLLEHGSSQADAIREMLTAQGYINIDSIRDLSGHMRVTIGVRGVASAFLLSEQVFFV